MNNELINSHAIEKFALEGWHPIDTNGLNKWAWSKKEALLVFPAGHTGFSLEFSNCPIGSSDLIVYHKGNEIRTYRLTDSITTINIPAGITSCRIKLDKPWIPKEILGFADERPLGICLYNIRPLKLYSSTCNHVPSVIEMGLSGICNINPPCVMCYSRNSKSRIERPHLPQNIIDKMMPYLNYAEAVSLHGSEGETLLSPSLLDILSSIDTKRVYTVFASNGLLLTKEISERLISAGLKEINISVDAAHPDTYYKIRNNDGFHMLCNNIKEVVKIKKERGISSPKITINMAIMKENCLELPEFIDLAHELGVSSVQIRLLVPIPENYEVNTDKINFNYYEQRVSPNSDVFKRIVNIANIKTKQYGITLLADNPEIIALLGENSLRFTNRITLTLLGDNKDDLSSIMQEEPKCIFPWKNIIIDLNGAVRFCCHSRQVLGNLNEEDLSEIWNGKIAQDARKDLLRNEMPGECLACPLHLSQHQIWQNLMQ